MPRSPSPPQTPVPCQAVVSTFATEGQGFQLVAPSPLAPDDTVLRGRFRVQSLRCGLSLHATDAVDLHDLTTRGMTNPGLTVALFLRGDADVSLGDRRYRVTAGAAPALFVLSRAEPDLFVRRGARGNWVRKLTINVPPDWLDGDQFGADPRLRRFGRTHGADAVWTPSPRQIQLAERVIGPTPYGAAMESLYLESHALEIVAETLARLAERDGACPKTSPETSLSARDRDRIRAVCDRLDAHGEDCGAAGLPGLPSLKDLARDAGMSVSALQRLFHAAFGTSVFEHHRGVRMERARDRLARERISVTEASYVAGYGNPANFATAFKRRFGLSPKDVRGLG